MHPDPRSRHLFVSDAELGDTLRGSPREEGASAQVDEALRALEAHIQQRVEATLMEGGTVPWVELASSFRLSDEALDVLIALAAVEIDARFARACTNAWADFTRKQADVSFLLELLGRDWAHQQALRELFAPEGPLVQWRLIQARDSDRWAPGTPLLYRSARASDRLVDFLLTGRRDRLDEQLAAVARLEFGGPEEREALLLPREIKDHLERVLRSASRERHPARVVLLGPTGCGRRSLARAMAAQPGRGLLVLQGARLPRDAQNLSEVLRLAMRDARLAGADLYLSLTPEWGDDRLDGGARRALLDLLAWSPETVWIGAETAPEWVGELRGLTAVAVPFPTFEIQEALWRRQLAGHAALEPGFHLPELVTGYSLSGGAIEAAAQEALHAARLHSRGRQVVITRDALFSAAQKQLSHRLGLLAEKVTRTLSWDDLVLPEKVLESLKELTAQYRHQHRVFHEWGFSAKVAYGRGLSALFHGPPGTGKTMVAGVIARELGLELYKVDLSRVVDKYIGETEKNLGRIFDEAARSQAILLFDEADSLFSKRTAVKSSHDRYANLETNFLLQRIESFEGVCLLTSNFESSIDEAFKRRLRFKIAFPFPSKEERVLLWKAMIPVLAAASKDLNFHILAAEFEMAGGHIKNAVLRAAFMAARAQQHINQDILYQAAMDEYREMGKLVKG
jgi:SpoVK/Ycf46/Vps4 family AAA+-type ATPase